MKIKNYYKYQSQLALPFLETNEELIQGIFQALEQKLGLNRNSKQIFIDLGAGDGRIVLYCTLNYGIRSFGIEINEFLVKEINEKIKMVKKEKLYKKNVRQEVSCSNTGLENKNT